MTKIELRQMQELDSLYSESKSTGDEDDDDDHSEEYIRDPYARSKAHLMKHQEYRTIKVGPDTLLKNGQMIQVSVCDPFDENLFHPTDKIILAKHNGKYFAL